MTEPMNLGANGILGQISELALDFPRAFAVITCMMRQTPRYDQYSGYGALQGPTLWFQLELSHEQYVTLLTLTKDNADLLYLVLRAHSFKFWQPEEFKILLDGGGPMPFMPALKHVRKFIRGFGGPELTKLVRSMKNVRSRK